MLPGPPAHPLGPLRPCLLHGQNGCLWRCASHVRSKRRLRAAGSAPAAQMVSTANCTLRRGPAKTGTPGCHAGMRSLRSDQPRSVNSLPRGRTYPTVRNLTITTSHVGWVLTEPVPREPGTARTEVECPRGGAWAALQYAGTACGTPELDRPLNCPRGGAWAALQYAGTACGTPELDRPLEEAKVRAVPPQWHATTCAPLDITQATVHPRACGQKST